MQEQQAQQAQQALDLLTGTFLQDIIAKAFNNIKNTMEAEMLPKAQALEGDIQVQTIIACPLRPRHVQRNTESCCSFGALPQSTASLQACTVHACACSCKHLMHP